MWGTLTNIFYKQNSFGILIKINDSFTANSTEIVCSYHYYKWSTYFPTFNEWNMAKKLIWLTASDKLCAGRPAKSKYLHLMLSPWLGAWTGSLTCFVRPSPLLHFPLQNFNAQYERTDLPMSPTTIRGTSTWKNRFNVTILITH